MLSLATRRARRRARRRRRRSGQRDRARRHRLARRRRSASQYDPTFRKYTKRYFGPAFDWRYFKAQGYRREWAQGDGDELGRCARHHAAHAVDLSGDRVAPSRVRHRSISPSGTSPPASCTIAICGVSGARTSVTTSVTTSCSRATTPARARSTRARGGEEQGRPAGVVERRADRADGAAMAISARRLAMYAGSIRRTRS